MHCHLGLISFIQGVRTGLLWCKEAGTLIIQSRVIFCGGRRVCDEITRQGRILMQRQYTSNLVDSEALEARWYCSILNFQLYLAVILLFHLFWEFFEGKTPTHNTIMFSCYLMNTIMVLFFTLAASFTRSVPLVRIVN